MALQFRIRKTPVISMPEKTESREGTLKSTVPFLKWAGGKRWLANTVAGLLGEEGRHVEPFAGSAACFFSSRATEGCLSDNNDELMNCFRMVRDNPRKLVNLLRQLDISGQTFERIRSSNEKGVLKRACRFLYLNRTAFNGIYRVNQLGQFNVPFGCKPGTELCDELRILNCSQRLQNVELNSCDFRVALARIRGSDAVFIDPPYTVKHNCNAFRRYNEQIFSWNDQETLAQIANRLAARDVRVVLSNAFHEDVVKLYFRKNFHALMVTRPSNLAASTSKRGSCEELLLISRATVSSTKILRRVMEDRLPNRTSLIRLRNG